MAEYIEREALLEDIEAAEENGGMGAVVAGTLRRYVMQQKAADVAEVRRGRWIDVEHKLLWCEDDVEICSCCSLCGAENALGETDSCPHCGADMRGADNGE